MTREQYGRAYEKGFRRTVAVLRRRGADAELAEELAQEAWGVRGWEHLAQLRDPRRVVAWINKIAIRLFLDNVATSRRMTDLTSAAVDVRISPAVNVAAIDLERALLQRCSERQRELIETVHLKEDRTAAEVAIDLGTSVGAIHHRLSRLRRRLRRAMNAA
jgi:RNA polymerase sigma factor (sigma-70 family)